jgi:hypothetical protein
VIAERITRLRARIAREPRALRDEAPGEPLYQAVHGLDAAAAADPAGLVGELAGRDDPVLRAEALRLARQAVRAALITPSQARSVLVTLLGDGAAGGGFAADVLRELAEPWAAVDPLPGDRFARFLAVPAAAGAAVEAAARHGHRGLLRETAADPGRPPAGRRRARE